MYFSFSAGGYFCLEPRKCKFCPCVLNDRDKLGYFLKRKAPNRTPPKPEFRASCSWVLFGRGTFKLAWIWFRKDYEIWGDIWIQRRGLNEIRLMLANCHSVVTLEAAEYSWHESRVIRIFFSDICQAAKLAGRLFPGGFASESLWDLFGKRWQDWALISERTG